MSINTVVTPDEVEAALRQDPKFDGAPDDIFAIVRKFPEIIGEERLGQLVTLEDLLRVEIELLPAITPDVVAMTERMQPGYGGMVEELYVGLVGQLNKVLDGLPEFLASQGISEEQALMAGQTPLNDAAAELYRSGRLTFGELIRVQPAVLLPSV